MPRIETEYMERGIRGTEKTVQKMHKLVALGKIHPTLHKIATWIRLSVPEDQRSSSRALADAVFFWVKRHGKFQRDPHQIERIEHPIEAMRPVIEARKKGIYKGRALFVGDCDLYTVMVAVFGGLLGFPYSWETVKVDMSRPDEFSHIYAALLVQGKWIAYDASTASSSPNWRPNVPQERFKRWSEPEIEKTLGMGGDSGMSKSNGNGMGLWPDEPGYFPRDYVGSGIPRSYGRGRPFIPKVDVGEFAVHIPRQPARPRSEIADKGPASMAKVPTPQPQARAPDMNYNYFPRPHYEPKKPYYYFRPPFPPRWPWSRQEETFIEQPVVWEPEKDMPVTVHTTVIRGAGYEGVGMGQTAEEFIRQAETLEAQAKMLRLAGQISPAQALDFQAAALREEAKAAAPAGGVQSTVEKIIEDMAKQIPTVSEAMILRMKARYQEKVETARARVAEAKAREAQALSLQAAGGPGYKAPTAWYEEPLVIGSVVVGGVLLTKALKLW